MNTWTSEQRNRVILLSLGTLVLLTGLWVFGVDLLKRQLAERRDKAAVALQKLEGVRAGVKLADRLREDVERERMDLAALEARMARGDLYRWGINHLREFEEGSGVTITDFSPPRAAEPEFPPKVPYRAANYSVVGSGSFTNIGRFIASLENSSQFIRLREVLISAAMPGVPVADGEALSFRLDFETLAVATSPTNRPPDPKR